MDEPKQTKGSTLRHGPPPPKICATLMMNQGGNGLEKDEGAERLSKSQDGPAFTHHPKPHVLSDGIQPGRARPGNEEPQAIARGILPFLISGRPIHYVFMMFIIGVGVMIYLSLTLNRDANIRACMSRGGGYNYYSCARSIDKPPVEAKGDGFSLTDMLAPK